MKAGHLSLRQATVVRGGRPILDSASLTCRTGAFTALCGANGAGKSTALSVLSGALKADKGAAFLGETPISKFAPRDLARMRAIVAQQSVLSFPFLVHEVVAMGRTPHEGRSTVAADERIIAQALDRLDLMPMATRNYLTLSGGERQRVQIARALAQLDNSGTEETVSSRWLLLDEPTSALDLKYQISLMKLLKALSREGWGIVAVLHDLHLVAQYVDEVVMFKDGAIIQTGKPSTVFAPEAVQRAYDLEAPFDVRQYL